MNSNGSLKSSSRHLADGIQAPVLRDLMWRAHFVFCSRHRPCSSERRCLVQDCFRPKHSSVLGSSHMLAQMPPLWSTPARDWFQPRVARFRAQIWSPRGSPERPPPMRSQGRVIHEFDPWFNYRATEYLAAHGSERFFKWFDHTVWYPLGRPVGTTIYPGMQFAAVWIWRGLESFGIHMSLNDVCVFMPAWFGVVLLGAASGGRRSHTSARCRPCAGSRPAGGRCAISPLGLRRSSRCQRSGADRLATSILGLMVDARAGQSGVPRRTPSLERPSIWPAKRKAPIRRHHIPWAGQ